MGSRRQGLAVILVEVVGVEGFPEHHSGRPDESEPSGKAAQRKRH